MHEAHSCLLRVAGLSRFPGAAQSILVQTRTLVFLREDLLVRLPLVTPPRSIFTKGALSTAAGLEAYSLPELMGRAKVVFFLRECDAASANVALLNREANAMKPHEVQFRIFCFVHQLHIISCAILSVLGAELRFVARLFQASMLLRTPGYYESTRAQAPTLANPLWCCLFCKNCCL